MSSRRTKSRGGRTHKPLTKALLLPMDRASANEQSLANHLALVACRSGHGNGHLVNELIRAVYLSWFLQRAGYGNYPAEQFKIAECAVEATLAHAHETGEWQIPSDVVVDFEALLALHDSQLASAPLHAVLEAEQRLRTFVGGTSDSPILLST
ncbi:hypothetical protein R69749_06912 [Paraburkholderia domus]|nr:hypothetical protein R69749_06912 [Paraburkholderia domus]